MLDFIRRLFARRQLHQQLRDSAILAALDRIDRKFDQPHDDMLAMRSDFTVTLYEPDDPRRKAASDVIGHRMMQRMIADENARRHQEGRPLVEFGPDGQVRERG